MQFICSDSIVKTQQQNCSISIPSIAVSDFSIVSPTDFRIIVNSNLFPETFPLIIAQFWRLLLWQFLRRPSKFFICAICTLNGFLYAAPQFLHARLGNKRPNRAVWRLTVLSRIKFIEDWFGGGIPNSVALATPPTSLSRLHQSDTCTSESIIVILSVFLDRRRKDKSS